MTAVALGLVVASAFIHALWNLLAKRVGGGATSVWLFAALGAILYAPVATLVLVTRSSHLGLVPLFFMAGSAVFHLAYFVFLQRGYAVGELSLVYPLARGTGPLLATAGAIALFEERPTKIALIGALLIGAGVLALAGRSRRGRDPSAIAFGLSTGLMIACYTLWDKHAVDALAVSPILMTWANDCGRAIMLLPHALNRKAGVRETWRRHRSDVLGVALLSPLAYILVLTALAFTPVSYVAPAREVSILIGAALGITVLAEGDARYRMIAAASIVAGVIALAVG